MRCKISDIADVLMGQSPKSEFYNSNGDGIEFLQGNRTFGLKYPTFDTFTTKITKLAKANDIIMSVRAPVGDLNITPIDVCLGRGVCSFRMKNGNQQYLFYLLKHYMKKLINRENGTVFGSVNKNDIIGLDINIEPNEEKQKGIGTFLSKIDDKIELNNKINENLEKQAQAIFKSWFVDFEPFGGVMPSDWEITNLLGIADYLNGLAMQKFRPSESECGIPVLKIKELRQGFTDNNSDLCSQYIKPEYIINDGDVIFSWSGSLFVDFWCGGKCGLNQHLFKVTSSNYEKWFYYSWTQHHLSKFVALASAMATTMGHIKRTELEKAQVLIPNQEVYSHIGTLLQPIYELVINNRIENTRLSSLRDEMLPKLMSGELDVSNINI